jgi:ubiquinone biosynthesis protein UbiJ
VSARSTRLPGAELFAALAQAPFVRALNHLLRGQPWLRERLMPFAGRTVALEMFPASLMLNVTAEGGLQSAGSAAQPDATVHASPATLARLAAGDERARAALEVSGDAALAAVVAGVFGELRWDAEEDLSTVLGDVAARRVTRGVQAVFDWQRQAATSLMTSLAEYVTEERALLARATDVHDWQLAVEALREDADRLEKRVERLAATRGRKR